MVIVEEKPKAPLEPPPRELSPIRVVVLLVVLCAIGFGVWQLVSKETPAASAKSDAVPVYSPYVDVTKTPTYPFQLPSSNPVSSVYLAFVVSDTEEPCTPSWGTFYTLDSAEQGLDLDARTAQLRSQGGSVMISYGGEANTELAVDCTDPAKLRQAYLEPIQRYKAKAIDLDIEGANLADIAANARRATAIAAVQKELAPKKKPLKVWMTLPVSSHGLTAEGIAAVQAMLKAKVKLAGVNAMTMDFGPGEGAEHDMLGTIERSLDATQAAGPVAVAGRRPAEQRRRRLGPRRRHPDARRQRRHRPSASPPRTPANCPSSSGERGIPRVSAWSLNRDRSAAAPSPRPANSPTPAAASSRSRSNSPTSSANCADQDGRQGNAAAAASAQTRIRPPATDDPATSPYPIWRPAAAYGSRL